jgi:hypothetical protein
VKFEFSCIIIRIFDGFLAPGVLFYFFQLNNTACSYFLGNQL